VPLLSRQVQGETAWISHYNSDYSPNPLNQAKELFRWYLLTQAAGISGLSDTELQSVLIDSALADFGG
jgi:hypothetical protein